MSSKGEMVNRFNGLCLFDEFVFCQFDHVHCLQTPFLKVFWRFGVIVVVCLDLPHHFDREPELVQEVHAFYASEHSPCGFADVQVEIVA